MYGPISTVDKTQFFMANLLRLKTLVSHIKKEKNDLERNSIWTYEKMMPYAGPICSGMDISYFINMIHAWNAFTIIIMCIN